MEDITKYSGNSFSKEATAPKDQPPPKIAAAKIQPPIHVKTGPWRRIKAAFISEDGRSVGSYLAQDVLVPALKDLLMDLIQGGAERTLYGDSRIAPSRSRNGGRSNNPERYSNILTSRGPERRREGPELRRVRNDFSNYIFRTAREAEVIADKLQDHLGQYEAVTVANFYEAMDITPDFTDNGFGWTDLRGIRVRKVRQGYILELPAPISLD